MLSIAAAAVIAAVAILVFTSGGGDGRDRHGTRPSGSSRPGGPTVVQAAASYLHIPPSEVRRRLRAGQTLGQLAATSKGSSRSGLIDNLYATRAAAIKARELPSAEEHAELTRLRRELTSQVDRARHPHSRELRLASGYLGVGESALARRLGGGVTLAQLAASTPGHSRAGLLGALLAPQRALLAHALHEHQISASQERRTLARIERRAGREISRPGG